MCISNSTCKPHVELAVDVFKTQTPTLISSLKDFFTALPSPKCVEEILAMALYQLADTDPDACRWLLRHPQYLEPELDLVEWATQFALKKLQAQGFVREQDFQFEPNGKLNACDRAKVKLSAGNSTAEKLILEEILQVGN
ncbi:MAG: hypothetical protein N4J56_004952 [Chroococcidiopsis sp. SAG 2025]|uniref:hypothetical protein n=1 Tax=Chroococcidiopsis sp. SAG 2025 TaxID=171389 RepID=UPI000B6E22D4|nr:hypothetical protein [Chroococcidiopsis sp. SAG 2025]MDV2995298.1 hypothetical protein [Chroococcidiopsis sp. SAG 2025]OWY66368.1 hypothetical protein B7486_37075 [cyanobacterium TDX16]